ncbi:MAG: DEAD/DEAH box helicase [Coprococcus sp.]
MIVATPGRLMGHMWRHTIRLENLIYGSDEVDEMLNMGFREDIDIILKSVPEERQTVLFSATMSREILAITKKYLTDPIRVQITKSQITVPSIRQYYLEVSQENKIDVLARLIDINNFKLSMVFCNTKRRVDELTHEMIARGYQAEGLHGDRSSPRDRVMGSLNGQAEILATDVPARGLILKMWKLSLILVFLGLEYYVHRISGPEEPTGKAYLFLCRSSGDKSSVKL